MNVTPEEFSAHLTELRDAWSDLERADKIEMCPAMIAIVLDYFLGVIPGASE